MGSNAENAGLLSGDSIVEINGFKTPYFKDFREEIQKYKSQEVDISFYRNNSYNTLSVLTNANAEIGYLKFEDRRIYKFKKYLKLFQLESLKE